MPPLVRYDLRDRVAVARRGVTRRAITDEEIRHRGGPMFYADAVGPATVLARVNAYRQQFVDYWRPAVLLEQLANEGRGFHGEVA